jgi:hypothetical protein
MLQRAGIETPRPLPVSLLHNQFWERWPAETHSPAKSA